MNYVHIVMAITLTALLAEVEASVMIGLGNPGTNGTTRSSTFSKLDADPFKSSYKKMVPAGSLSASDMGAGESFAVMVTAVKDWDYAAATGAGSVKGYLNGLTPTNISGNDKGWGVDQSDSRIGNVNAAGEAMVVTFDLSSLNPGHRSRFRLENVGVYGRKEMGYNYMVVDASGDLVVASATGQKADTISLDVSIKDGDTLVVGHEAGDFKFASFTVDVIDNSLQQRPEPTQPVSEPVQANSKPTRKNKQTEIVDPKIAKKEERKALKKEERKIAKAIVQPNTPISRPAETIQEPQTLGLIL